mmetsp:Transcript_39460/g.55573  ORF Transcript_39460/g.55573 Transcript_39460/m.55573 type:complete len:82 (-) Transcript_39460:582-827(-)
MDILGRRRLDVEVDNDHCMTLIVRIVGADIVGFQGAEVVKYENSGANDGDHLVSDDMEDSERSANLPIAIGFRAIHGNAAV